MAEVIWTEPALSDLKDIIDYIAKDSLAYAARFGTRLVEAPRRLERFPNCGRIVPEFQDERIRELICDAYRLIYLIAEDDDITPRWMAGRVGRARPIAIRDAVRCADRRSGDP